MSSLGYSSKDIAVSLGLSPEDVGLFVRDAETVGTSVNFLIREGILVARAAPEIKLHEAAEGGNVEAIKQLEAVRKRHTFERLIEQMDDDEFNRSLSVRMKYPHFLHPEECAKGCLLYPLHPRRVGA